MGIDNSCHVVFLIDTHEQTLALWKIKHIILQILLYFFASVDKDTTWGFRFFNSQSAVVDVIKHPFYPITDESIELFVAHYSQQINKESKRHTLNSTSARRNTPYAVLKETLMQLLAEFQWSNTDSYSSYVSTRRTPKSGCFVSGKSCQGVTIINHVYLLTDCPETHEKMLHFVGHSLPPSITTTTEEMQQTKTLAKAVQFMAYDMQKSLWENYVKRQISLNWINTSPTAATLEETKGVQRKIALGLSRFLDLFGGHLFPHYLALIHHAKYGYSFTSIFDAYYSSQMETIVKHTGAPTTHQSHSLSTYYALMNSPGTDPKDTFWQGLFKINSENGIFSLNITHTSYKVELVPFFSATRQIPKEDCSIPSHTIDLFQKVTCLNTMVTVPTADIDPHWFDHDSNAPAELQFVLQCMDKDDTSLELLVEALTTSHQVLLAALEIPGQSPQEKEGVWTCVFLEPLVSGALVVHLLPCPVRADTLVHSMMAADRSALLPLGTNVFDMCAFPDSATYYNETFGQYWEGQTTYTPVDLSGSAEVEEIVMRRKEIRQEQQRAEEEALEKQRTPQKIEAVDAPLNGLPADLPALFTTIRRLYLEALYTGKWTIFGMMTTLLSCVEAATEFCNASDVISLLSRWTRDWEGMENHHQAIKECLSGERASLSYLEAYYVDQWEVNELILVSKEERRATVIKALKMRETKLQIVMYLTIIVLKESLKSEEERENERQERIHKAERLKSKKNQEETGPIEWHQMNRRSKAPEELVHIFFDRLLLWKMTTTVSDDLLEIDLEREESKAERRIDPSDLDLSFFVNKLGCRFSKTLPDILEIYIEQISDDMETPEYDRESSIKGTHPPIRSKLRRQNTDTTSPITGKRYLYEENSIESNKSQKRRVASSAGHSSRERENQLRSSQRQKDKTREREKEREREREREIKRERQREHRPITSTLRSRHTSKSTGISHSLADTSTSRSSQDTHSKPINRAKLIPELPFMKRQIDMAPSTHKSAVSRIGEATRAMDAKVERSKVNGRPTIKRAGSFTTGARVPKPIPPTDPSFFTENAKLRRPPNSPTTPRTRMGRQFGFDFHKVAAPLPRPIVSSLTLNLEKAKQEDMEELKCIQSSLSSQNGTEATHSEKTTPCGSPSFFNRFEEEGMFCLSQSSSQATPLCQTSEIRVRTREHADKLDRLFEGTLVQGEGFPKFDSDGNSSGGEEDTSHYDILYQ